TGTYRADWLEATDADGIKVKDALKSFCGDPTRVRDWTIAAESAIGDVELHIEQGPVLEHQGDALGVVTSIAGQSRF
ncbi:hypothetical protein ABTM86_20410, partial [Acinetobacter baumannii]